MLNFRTFTIYRLMDPGEESGFEYERELTKTQEYVTGYLETASAEFTAMVDGEFGKTFRLYSDDLEADVVIGDRLTENGKDYDVKGVQLTNDGPGRKLEIVLVEPIEQ